jgi:methionyl-tRNA formyltransferase
MKKMSETIVFFGSGPVAAKSLALLARDFEIEAVITKPQPPHHKEDFPVLALAQELGLKTLTTADQAELSKLFAPGRPAQSNLGVVIDYGILIPQSIIDHFPLGIVNSHFSLLPRWRGADPISFAILNGDKETGVSLMLIVEAMDEGPLLAQRSLTISPEATTPSLTDDLIALSHAMLAEQLPAYAQGQLKPYPQPDEEPTYSRKLTKQDGRLDFTKPAVQLAREVRAYAGWPRSRTTLGTTDVIITGAHVGEGGGEPGSLRIENKQLAIYTGQAVLVIDSLIPAGKKEMPAAAFMAGYRLS